MITLNDYLYSGDTIPKILMKYIADLRQDAKCTHNEIDLVHCNFLLQIKELLEHNDFLTAQSQQIREFYKYMAKEYPTLAFTFKGRIKSLIRAEEKFNGYIVEYISDYYREQGTYPPVSELKNKLNWFPGSDRLPHCDLHSKMPPAARPGSGNRRAEIPVPDCQRPPGIPGRTGLHHRIRKRYKIQHLPSHERGRETLLPGLHLRPDDIRLPLPAHHLLRQQFQILYGNAASHQDHG